MTRWRAAPVALLIVFGLATPAQPSSRHVDAVAMKRLFLELRVETGRFVNTARTFLFHTGRWYPEGDDLVLWNGIKAFENAVDAVAGEYSRAAHPKRMDEETRTVMERARELDGILATADILPGLKLRWSDLEALLTRAADEYGWDYAKARFEALPLPALPELEDEEEPLYQPRSVHFEDDIDPNRRQREMKVPSRFTISDDLAVGEAINDVDHLTRSVLAQLSAGRVSETGDLRGIADPNRDDGWDLPYEMEMERIEADLLAFESAATEAQHRFALTQRAADIRVEVATMIKLGRRIEVGFLRERPSEDTLEAWGAVRGRLNFLAVVYDLETLRYE